MSLGKIIEFVNFPEVVFRRPKIVQLYVRKDSGLIPVVIFQNSTKEGYTDHNNILKQYLDENKIKYETKQFEPKFPKLEGELYRVEGMGKIQLDFKKNIWTYTKDKSEDYHIGLSLDKELNNLIKQEFKDLGLDYRKTIK